MGSNMRSPAVRALTGRTHHPTSTSCAPLPEGDYASNARRYQTQSTKAFTPLITMSNKVVDEPMVFTAKKTLEQTDYFDVTEFQSVSLKPFGTFLGFIR